MNMKQFLFVLLLSCLIVVNESTRSEKEVIELIFHYYEIVPDVIRVAPTQAVRVTMLYNKSNYSGLLYKKIEKKKKVAYLNPIKLTIN